MSTSSQTRIRQGAAAAVLMLLVIAFPAWASAQSPILVGPANNSSISADGRYMAFESVGDYLLEFDANNFGHDVFVRDLHTGAVTLVSVNYEGSANANKDSFMPMISADGRYVVFLSYATDLVPENVGTAQFVPGIFLRDLQAGTTIHIATGARVPFISANGQSIVFDSLSQLVPEDNNNSFDVYAFDVPTQTLSLVSVNRFGSGSGNAGSFMPTHDPCFTANCIRLDRSRKVISDDGRYVVFTSAANNLVALNDNNDAFEFFTRFDVFVRDLQTGTTTLVSMNSPGRGTGDNRSSDPVISADGKIVAFASRSTNLGVSKPPASTEVFARNLETATTELVSVRPNATNPNTTDFSTPQSMSADGRHVAFISTASDLVTNDGNGGSVPRQDAFVRDRQSGTTTLVSVNVANSDSGNHQSTSPQINADGRFVAFVSSASNLVTGVTKNILPPGNVISDVYVRDLQEGKTKQLSVDHSGTTGGNHHSESPSITRAGELVAFESFASNLVSGALRRGSYPYLLLQESLYAALTQTPELKFSAGNYALNEGDNSIEVTIMRTGALDQSVTVDYLTMDHTAVAVEDYTPVSGTLTFAPGETIKTINISIFPDELDEPDEEVLHIYLHDFNHSPGTAPTELDMTTVTVSDDDAMPILKIQDMSVIEGDAGVEVLTYTATLSAPTNRVVFFNVRPADGTAQGGSDYSSGLFNGRFEPGETSKNFTANVVIRGDRMFETNETFLFNISSAENAVAGDPGVVTILNDDPVPTVSVEDATTTEGVSQFNFAVSLSNPSYLPVTVRFSTMDGTAKAVQDYSERSATLTFAPGSTTPEGNESYVLIKNDETAELTEAFSIVISNATNATISDPDGTITILDNDVPLIEFATDSADAPEGGTATVIVHRTGVSNAPISVDYTIQDGTATAGADYNSQTGTLVFGADEFEKSITFNILEDALVEGTETVNLILRNASGAVIGSKAVLQVRILDNDSCTFSLNPSTLPDFPSAGATSAFVEVERPSPICTFTAVSNNDFITNVSINGSRVSFSVAANPNTVARTGTLTIAGQTLTIRQSGTPISSTFEFESSTYAAVEGARNVEVKVFRRGNTNGTASVRFRTIDDPAAVPCDPTATQPGGTPYLRGTAYGRCDYATTVETLTWAANDSDPKTITIPLIDDAHAEGTESFRLSLSDPQGGDVGGIGAATVTISDNDSTPGQNPIRNHAFFVRQHYLDFLSREPEAGEPWTAILNNCPDAFNTNSNSVSAQCDRILVSSSFYLAPEFRLKGFYAYQFYRAALDRRPEYAEIVVDMRDVTGQTPEEVFRKRAAFAAAFVERAEFKARYDGLGNADYVAALLSRYNAQQITTEDPQQPESTTQVTLTRQQLTEGLNSNTLTRAQVLRAVVQSEESARDEFYGAFVAMQYYGYLRRTPEQEGYEAWLRVIREDPNNIRVMINGFLNSPEYSLRFGQP